MIGLFGECLPYQLQRRPLAEEVFTNHQYALRAEEILEDATCRRADVPLS